MISLVFDKSSDTMDVTFAECVKERDNIMSRVNVIQHSNVQIRGNCTARKLLYLYGEMEMIWCFQNKFLLIIWFHTIKLFTSNVGTFLCFVLQHVQKSGTNISFFSRLFQNCFLQLQEMNQLKLAMN